MSQNLRSQVLRQALRLVTRAAVVHSATLLARFPRHFPAANPALRAVLRKPSATAERRRLADPPASRAQEKGKRCLRFRADLDHEPSPPTAQKTPAACRLCRPRNSESALRMPPPGKRPDAATSAMPPGSPRPVPSRTSRPSWLPCRHVAAFRTSAHPPPLSRPRPIGPQKESPQSKAGCRPRKLRVHPSFHCELVE